MRETYTVKQVADILGYSTNSIYTFLKEKRIKAVRMGHGRFRIPQEEVDRLLYGKKIPAGTGMPVGLPSPTAIPVPHEKESHHSIADLFGSTARHKLSARPSLFDWLVSFLSLVLGASMFLFADSAETFAVGGVNTWMTAVQIGLVVGAVGLLVTEISSLRYRGAHAIFHGLLFVAYAGLALLIGQRGDYDGAWVLGSMAVVFGGGYLFGLGSVRSLTLYVLSLFILAPVSLWWWPAQSHVALMIPLFAAPPWREVFTALLIVDVVALVWGYWSWRWLYWVLMTLVGAGLVGTSIWEAMAMSWGRSFFFLAIGLVCIAVPWWESLSFTKQLDRRLAQWGLACVGLLFLVTMGFTRLLQGSLLVYGQSQLEQKLTQGTSMVAETVQTAKTIMSVAGTNPLMVAALAKHDIDGLTVLARSMFEGNRVLRRILAVGPTGDVLMTYPFASLPKQNIADREYFTAAVATKRLYISDLFETIADGQRRFVITIAVPVLDKEQHVVGLLLGSVDLPTLDQKLHAAADDGEYFILTDKKGSLIVAPTANLLGTDVEGDSPLLLGLSGRHGTAQHYGYDAHPALVSYGSVQGLGWGIGIYAPIDRILHVSLLATGTIFLVSFVSIVFVAVLWVRYWARPVRSWGAGG